MFAGRVTHKILRWGRNDDGEYTIDDDREEVDDVEQADVVSSIQARNNEKGIWHLPVLDLDIPHRYVPSTTEGHGHLYIDHMLTWDDYKELLTVLEKFGILESGYVGASIHRGHTAVRLPWIKKNNDVLPI